jgi:hypothetical protein
MSYRETRCITFNLQHYKTSRQVPVREVLSHSEIYPSLAFFVVAIITPEFARGRVHVAKHIVLAGYPARRGCVGLPLLIQPVDGFPVQSGTEEFIDHS